MPTGDVDCHDEACRCSVDPNSDGGEYRALADLRERKRRDEQLAQEEAQYEQKTYSDEEDSNHSDSDDEFDYLLDEDFEQDESIKELEEKRRSEMEYQMLMRQVAGFHGYGVHRQLHPNRVLRIAGLGRNAAQSRKASIPAPPRAVVLHLVDPDSEASASLDYFLEKELAKEYPGTMFLRSAGRMVLMMDSSVAKRSFPSNVLDADKDMPALLAIRDGVVVNSCPRLLGLGDGGEIEPHAVRQWLDRSRVLLTETPMEELCFIRPEQEVHMDFMQSQMQQQAKPLIEEEEYYNCGVEGCCKTFKHEHVGVQTSEQSGLVVQEETILGEDS